jgi:hypothetical protein
VVVDQLPGIFNPRQAGQGAVEQLVEQVEAPAVSGGRSTLLIGDEISQDIGSVRAWLRREAANDFDLDALADEARLADAVGRDLLDHGGALGADE